MKIWVVAVLCTVLPAGQPSAARADSGAERRGALLRAAELLETNYVYPDQGRALALRLRREASAPWLGSGDPRAFAAEFTRRLRELSNDGHLHVDYREAALGGDSARAESSFTAAEFERWYGVGVNHGFEQVRRFDANVGYLDLRVFAPPAMAADMAVSAMTLLAQCDSLIIDLRRNGGGDGALGLIIAAYLVDGVQPMSGSYHRPTDKLTTSSTPVWVPGRRFGATKPVYVLISRETFSAAEAFAYDLQAARRVTVVGEPSGGGAHPFVYRRLSDHYVLSLPEARSVSPITGKDWQGVGVIPDVRIPADQALDEALKLARAATPAH